MNEPISAWSNLAFLIPAGFALAQPSLTAKLFGATCIILCLGSGAFHYTHKHEKYTRQIWYYWQNWDERAMYICLSFAIAHLGYQLGAPALLVIITATVLAAVLSLLYARISSFTAIPALAIVLLVLAGVLNIILALVAAAVLVLAFLIRQKAESERCENEDIGHGIWHTLTAAVLTLITYF